MRNAEFGIRNLDSQSSRTKGLQEALVSKPLGRKWEFRRSLKDWIPRKCGAGLQEFTALKSEAEMIFRSSRGFFEHLASILAKRFRTPKSTFRNHIKVLFILCTVLITGCGYQMVGKETHIPPGLNSVAVPTFKNRTYEPGIEIPFTQAFLREFILDKRVRVVDRAQADSVLEGVIKDFRMYSVSYDQSGLVLEYQTTVILDVTLKDRTGKVLWEEKNFSETQWFRASSNVLTSEANKAAAIQQIGVLVAGRFRNRFFYNF